MPGYDHFETIRSALAELDFETDILPAPEPLIGDHVVASIPSDLDIEPWVVSFTPMLGLEEDIDDADLIQMMSLIPFTAKPPAFPDLARLLININNKTIVGAFGLRETDGLLFYKNTLVLPDHSTEHSVVIQNTFLLAGFLLDQFVDAIEMIVLGGGSLADAKELRPDLDDFVNE